MERDEKRNGMIQQQNGDIHPPTHLPTIQNKTRNN